METTDTTDIPKACFATVIKLLQSVREFFRRKLERIKVAQKELKERETSIALVPQLQLVVSTGTENSENHCT